MTTAHGVLASVAQRCRWRCWPGRVGPAVLFAAWAAATLLGLASQELLASSNPALATPDPAAGLARSARTLAAARPSVGTPAQGRVGLATLRLSAFACLISAFMNNTAVVGALLGMVTSQRRHPASKLLIPLSYASILGGITTLVGTSTNLVVNSFVIDAGLPPLQMFQFAWVGIPVALACIGVMARSSRLLPANASSEAEARSAYFLEARVAAGSPMIGRSIETNRLRNLEGLFCPRSSARARLISPVGQPRSCTGDVLVFTRQVARVQTCSASPGWRCSARAPTRLLKSNLVEVVLASGSDLPTAPCARSTSHHVRCRGGRHPPRRPAPDRPARTHPAARRRQPAAGRGPGLPAAPQPRPQLPHPSTARVCAPKLSRMQSVAALSGFALVILVAALGWLPLFGGLLVLLAALLGSGLLTLGELRRRFPFETAGGDRLRAGDRRRGRAFGRGGAGRGLDAGDLRRAASMPRSRAYLITLTLTEVITNTAAAALAFPIALGTRARSGSIRCPS